MRNLSRRPVLGLDLDGVVLDYIAAFRAWVADSRGIPEDRRLIELPDPAHWDWVDSGWFDEQGQFMEAHAAAAAAGMNAAMPVLPGASDALWRLSDAGVHIRVITHRLIAKNGHQRAVADTVESLDRHRIPYTDLCFVGSKADVGADVYVDDAPHNVEALRATGRPVVVFGTTYNTHLPGPRARDWAELEPMLGDLLLADRETAVTQ